MLSLRHATKSFGAIHALADVSIDLRGGEVHALVGENGAGKSTLVKILAGVYVPDDGTIVADGREVVLHSPAAARDAGIAVIYQEPTLFPDLSVAENIFIGRQPLHAGRRIDGRAMQAQAAAIFERLGVPLDPGRIARGLSIADQQIVEIGKALSLDARVIVMDEPTAALSATEVDRLFDIVRALREAGTAVLFISHRLEEVFEICQRVTVMRDGRHVFTREPGRPGIRRPDQGHGRPRHARVARRGPRRGGRAGAAGGAPDPRGRLHRRLVRGPGRRDRGPGRTGRGRPQRGRAGDLRDRPVRRRAR